MLECRANSRIGGEDEFLINNAIKRNVNLPAYRFFSRSICPHFIGDSTMDVLRFRWVYSAIFEFDDMGICLCRCFDVLLPFVPMVSGVLLTSGGLDAS